MAGKPTNGASGELQGVIVPIITPLTAAGGLDAPGMGRLTERLIAAGVDGIFVGGTTGEFLALTPEVRVESFHCVAGAAAGRVTLVAGIGDSCLENVLRYADAAEEAGMHSLALLPPPYFPLSEGQIRHFLEAMIGQLALPVVLYNIPGLLGKTLAPSIVAAFAGCAKVIGIKDSSGDMNYFGEILKLRGERFRVIMGNESYMRDAFRLGADGIVPSIANVIPQPCVACYAAARRGDWDAADAAQRTVIAKLKSLLDGGNWLDMIGRIKAELREQGVCEGHLSRIFTGGNSHRPRT